MKKLLFLLLVLNNNVNALPNPNVQINYDYNEHEYLLIRSATDDELYSVRPITLDGIHDIKTQILTKEEYNELKKQKLN